MYWKYAANSEEHPREATLPSFIEITLRDGCSPVNLLHIFRTTFTKNTSERMLLKYRVHRFQYLEAIVLEARKRNKRKQLNHVNSNNAVLKNFTKFTRKRLCQIVFKKDSETFAFTVNFVKFFKQNFL